MTRPFENLLKVAREAHQLGMADFRRMHEELKDQANVAVGSAKVLGGTEEVTLSDVGRLGKAAAKDALDSIDLSKPVESIRKIADTAYAVSTTTTEGVDAITGALRESVKFEGKAALAGGVAATGICRGLLMSGVPPVQAAGLVLGVLNMAGSATQVSEALRKFGGGDSTRDSALLQEVHQILAEKGSK